MILQNGFRDTVGVFRTYGGTISNNAYPVVSLGNYCRTGMMRNLTAGEGITSNAVGVPMGYAGRSWIMPQTAGMLSGQTSASLGADGTMLRGFPIEGSADLSVTVNTPSGELIVSGNGTATFSIACDPLLLTASLNGTGSSTLTVAGSTSTLGAEASIEGTALVSVTIANATILPLDDDSPLRTGTATLTLTGTLVPYAIGSMSGTTEEAGLTPNGISNAVWGKVIESGFSADQIMRLLASFAAGSATGLEGANPRFTGLDGVTLRIDGTYAAGTRTIDALNVD